MRRKKITNKAYIFMMDGMFAIVVLVIGLLIIMSTKPYATNEIQVSMVSENVVGLLSQVKIIDLCDGCKCTNAKLKELCQNSEIKNNESTLLGYFGELYSFGDKNHMITDLFSNLSNDLYRKDLYGSEIKIQNITLYSDSGIGTSRNLISRKKMVFGYYEQGNGIVEFWGPYNVEVNTWEK
jgi:hypothetical protein